MPDALPSASASAAAPVGLGEDVPALVARNLGVYERAARRGPETVAELEVVGRPVRLRVAGAQLAKLMLGTMGHLAAPGRDPDLTICAWTGDEPGLAAERSVSSLIDPTPTARTLVRGGSALVVQYGDGTHVLQGVGPGRSTIFLWARDVDALSRTGDRTKPALEGLHTWLLDTPWQPMHAAAVGGEAGGVLLAGPRGAGKSTAALACLRAGWRYAGDDYVAVTQEPEPRVEMLYRSARLNIDMAARFPDLDAARVGTVTLGARTKHDMHLTLLGSARTRGFPLRALVLPRVTGGATVVRPATASDAMIRLSSTTLFQLRGDTARAFEKMAGLVEALPAYWLELGGDLDRIPATITAGTGVAPA